MSTISPYIRIVCEGARTEPNYLNGWLNHNGYKASNPAFKAKDNSPRGVVKEAKRVYKEARSLKIPPSKIQIWAVFDKDEHAGIPQAIDEANNAAINVAFSNTCFEHWILLHYAKITQPFSSCDEIIHFIKQHHDPNYEKSIDHFTRLKDSVSKAMSNGTWLLDTHWQYDDRPIWEKNPYTNVHQMLSQITTLLNGGG